jgi:hypothetical protein
MVNDRTKLKSIVTTKMPHAKFGEIHPITVWQPDSADAVVR